MSTNTLADLIDGLMLEQELAALPTWEGAPLHFTTAYWSATDFEAAFTRWTLEKNALGSARQSHMWHPALCSSLVQTDKHSLVLLTADLRCNPWHAHGTHDFTAPCYCTGSLLTMGICHQCEQQWITDNENDVVETWHDHAFPGWRDLPTLPAKLRGQMGTHKMTLKLEAWFAGNYPNAFRVPGAPILTDRGAHGSRHVPTYSPYGGYDISTHSVRG